jgi:hypothetical protein
MLKALEIITPLGIVIPSVANFMEAAIGRFLDHSLSVRVQGS